MNTYFLSSNIDAGLSLVILPTCRINIKRKRSKIPRIIPVMIFQFHSMDKSVSTVTPVDSYAAISLVGSAFFNISRQIFIFLLHFLSLIRNSSDLRNTLLLVSHTAPQKPGQSKPEPNSPKRTVLKSFFCVPPSKVKFQSHVSPLTDRLVRMPNSKIPAVTNPTIIYPIRRFNFSTGFATISYHSLFRINMT